MKVRTAMDVNPLPPIRSRLQSWLHETWLPVLFVVLLFGTWEAC